MVNTASKGTRMLRRRIDAYEAEGWTLIHREQRTKWGIIDVGGAWDAWYQKDGVWLFEQCGPVNALLTKQRECAEWIKLRGARSMEGFPLYIVYRIAVYRNAGWRGRGKEREYHREAEWEIYEYNPAYRVDNAWARDEWERVG